VAAHRFCDEFEGGFGWILDERLGRASHALVVDGRTWLVDPVDVPGLEERLGQPGGVIQLLDRHDRDCAALAGRLGVPHHEVPIGRLGPFDLVPLVRLPFWRESALWWPDARVLVVADALGTVGYFRERREPIGVHPFLRPWPPKQLGRFEPLHLLCGHGEGLHGERAAEELRRALARSCRGLPGALLNALRRD
jgi:hypothetical protein